MALSVAGGIANAWDFAYGVNPSVSAIQLASASTGTGSQTYIVETAVSYTPDGTLILPLFVNAVLTVGNGPNAENVVVTAVSAPNPGGLNANSFTASFANTHGIGENVASGSFGAQEAANWMLTQWGGGLVALTQRWFRNFTNKAAGITALTGYKSLSNLVTMLDYSGVPTTSFSYNAAANSIYASTTNKLY